MAARRSSVRGDSGHLPRGVIPGELLEIMADVLLARAGRDPEYPAYSEPTLRRKCTKSERAEELFAGHGGIVHSDCLLRAEMDELLDSTGLSNQEKAAWEMYTAGCLVAEIARLLKVPAPTAARMVKTASRRVSACAAKYRGLYGIYRKEVRRYIYRKPTHCRDQHCRRLGYCIFAAVKEGSGDPGGA